MNNSKKRHAGGAWRRKETMISLHVKAGKDRAKQGKRKKKRK